MSANGLLVPPERPCADFDALTGFGSDDLGSAFACFYRSAGSIVSGQSTLRGALPAAPGLRAVCEAALALGPVLSHSDAMHFFQSHFVPEHVCGDGSADGFLTGYYEPVVDGSPVRTRDFSAPLLARPDDLVTLAPDDVRPPAMAGFAAGRPGPGGSLEPYPDRAAIETLALEGAFRPVVWLRDWVEAFLIHVQGSARVRLTDGTLLRVTYAGRNGHPYTSIGRILVESGAIGRDAMSLDLLKSWLRQHGQEPGDQGRTIMQRNASFIFFEAEPATSDEGPIGGEGLPLQRLRSIAVDRTLWCYGLPFWIEAELPWQSEAPTRFQRLMIAQDTGSAIIGPARADIFFGTGDAAGRLAGSIRHRGRFHVLRPRLPGGGPA